MPKGVYKRTEKYKREVSERMKGVKLTDEHRKNISEAKKGKKATEETKRKMSISQKKRGKWNEQQKKRLSFKRFGKLNPNWKEGKYTADNYRRTARKIMAKHLGRPLLSKENVHHMDGDYTNNNIDNLYLFSNRGKHISYHIKLKKFVNEELSKIGFYYNIRNNILEER